MIFKLYRVIRPTPATSSRDSARRKRTILRGSELQSGTDSKTVPSDSYIILPYAVPQHRARSPVHSTFTGRSNNCSTSLCSLNYYLCMPSVMKVEYPYPDCSEPSLAAYPCNRTYIYTCHSEPTTISSLFGLNPLTYVQSYPSLTHIFG